MNLIQSDKLVKIRKAHICFACGRKFYPPAEMYNQINDYDGIASLYTCLTCKEIIERYPVEIIDESENIFFEFCVINMLHEYQRIYPHLYTIEELLDFKINQKKK